MTKLRIISKLWSVIYDLRMYINGTGTKTIGRIDRELDVLEHQCRKYTDIDDTEELP